jgi:hypothetical protein
MSQLQQYLNNAMSVDDQESAADQDYKATKDQLKAIGEEVRQQALGSLPFSIAEVSRGVSGLYRTLEAGRNLVQRKGGLGDLISGIVKGSDEPFDIGKLANRVAGEGGDQLVARFGAQAKSYGIDLGAIRDASKSGGIDGAVAATKTQLGAIADKNIARASTEIDRGVGQFTAAVGGKAAELQSAVQEFSGKGLDELKTIQSRFGETLKSYSPADISNLSEAGRAQYKQLTDIVGRGDATPEGLARLKTGTQAFTQRVGLEQEVGRLSRAKEMLSEQATQARTAVSQKTRALTDEHEAKLSAADERLNKLQTQKEASEDIVAKARGRLTQQSQDIMKAQPTEENLGGTSSYRSGGSMNINRQVRQSQSSIDEALIAKHQNIAEGLDKTISETQVGKQQMISQFNSKVEEATAPIREQLAQIAPKIQSATEAAESLGTRASALGSAALEGLGHVAAVGGLGMGLYQAASGQLQTADQRASAALNITAGSKQLGETVASKLSPAATEGGLSEAEATAKASAEAAVKSEAEKAVTSTVTKGAVEAGAELGTEAAVEAGSSVLPVVGEAVDIGLGLAMGIQSLVDIFGGRHDAAPPPPTETVGFQKASGVF